MAKRTVKLRGRSIAALILAGFVLVAACAARDIDAALPIVVAGLFVMGPLWPGGLTPVTGDAPHYLVIAESSRRVDIAALTAKLGDDRLSFASPERLATHSQLWRPGVWRC